MRPLGSSGYTRTQKVHNVNPFIDIYRCGVCGHDYKYEKNGLSHLRMSHEFEPANRPLKKQIVNPGNFSIPK